VSLFGSILLFFNFCHIHVTNVAEMKSAFHEVKQGLTHMCSLWNGVTFEILICVCILRDEMYG